VTRLEGLVKLASGRTLKYALTVVVGHYQCVRHSIAAFPAQKGGADVTRIFGNPKQTDACVS
jgi:hypothetical protein